jgi:hypothetical protein
VVEVIEEEESTSEAIFEIVGNYEVNRHKFGM